MESFSNLAIVFFVTLPSDSFTDSKANTDSDDKIKQKEFSERKKELYLLLPGNLHVDNNQNKYIYFFAQVIGTALPLAGSW